jgi:hypothetical protein
VNLLTGLRSSKGCHAREAIPDFHEAGYRPARTELGKFLRGGKRLKFVGAGRGTGARHDVIFRIDCECCHLCPLPRISCFPHIHHFGAQGRQAKSTRFLQAFLERRALEVARDLLHPKQEISPTYRRRLPKTEGLPPLSLDARARNVAFGPHLDSALDGSTRALTRGCHPFVWTSGEDNKLFLYIGCLRNTAGGSEFLIY